jgi:predicted dehydrogenase
MRGCRTIRSCIADRRSCSAFRPAGEDGRTVLEAIFAAYESARTGRKVDLPFETDAAKPYDLWRPDE